MPRYIVKVDGLYGEWSTVVDAFVTKLMPLEEFRAFYEAEYGRSSAREFKERMECVEEKGTSSCLHRDADEVMRFNRCGPQEGCIPVAEVKALWKADYESK